MPACPEPNTDKPHLRLDTVSHAVFEACLGDTFRLRLEDASWREAELTSVCVLGESTNSGSVSPRRQPFSVVFRLADTTYLPQRIYRLENSRLGEIEIFLVPIGPDEKGMRLEAIFA